MNVFLYKQKVHEVTFTSKMRQTKLATKTYLTPIKKICERSHIFNKILLNLALALCGSVESLNNIIDNMYFNLCVA